MSDGTVDASKVQVRKAPKLHSRIQVPLEKLRFDECWRAFDEERKIELSRNFQNGDYLRTVMSDIQVLKDTDLDGNYYVDDGQSTACALIDLKAKFAENQDQEVADGEEDFEWGGLDSLIAAFESVWVTPVEYEDDSLKVRRVLQAQRHQEKNNTLRATSLHTMYDIGLDALQQCGNKIPQAICHLLQYLGKSQAQQSTARRWIVLGKSLEKMPLVVGQLKEMPWLKAYYILDNSFFTGLGASASLQLRDDVGLRLLKLLSEDADLSEPGKIQLSTQPKEFKEKWSKCFKVVELWVRSLKNKYGKPARDSANLVRLEDHLYTKYGMDKVWQCVESNTELHGSSNANPGIDVCRRFVEELEKCKIGKAMAVATECKKESGDDDAETKELTGICVTESEQLQAQMAQMINGNSGLSDNEKKIAQEARAQVDQIYFAPNLEALPDFVGEFEGKAITCLCEATIITIIIIIIIIIIIRIMNITITIMM